MSIKGGWGGDRQLQDHGGLVNGRWSQRSHGLESLPEANSSGPEGEEELKSLSGAFVTLKAPQVRPA